MYRVSFILFFVLLISSCAKKQLEPKELLEFIEDDSNGFVQTKTIDEYTFKVMYQPIEYIVLKEIKDNILTKKIIEEKKKELDNLQYFLLEIEIPSEKGDLLKYNLTDNNEYYYRLKYFSFDMQNDIQLIENKDTLPCVLYHFERTYGLTSKCKITLAFENSPKTNTNKIFVLNENVLGVGIVKLQFDYKELLNIPELKL